MRQPTQDQYRWHADFLNGRGEIHDGEPHPGWYKRRLVKNGPWMPVHIYWRQVIEAETGDLAEPEVLVAEQLGRFHDPAAIWTYCRPITEDDYRHIVERHQTIGDMAATNAPVDLATLIVRPK